MAYVTIQDLVNIRKNIAMRICGIWDEEEISDIEPISYLEEVAGRIYLTVWMFGNKKIYSAMAELIPGEWDDPTDPHGAQFFDVYRFKKIDDIRVDDYGCVISLQNGKKLELKSNSIEGFESFQFSSRGLVRLWDEYDD